MGTQLKPMKTNLVDPSEKTWNLEARTGVEPVHKGFADLSLSPVTTNHYNVEPTSVPVNVPVLSGPCAIPLKGGVALVDPEDFSRVAAHQWRAQRYKKRAYAIMVGSKGLRMHRFIMNPPEGVLVDHRDGNGLNNRRGNLRICTHTQNLANSKGKPTRRSRFKGVSFSTDKGRKAPWGAKIAAQGRRYFLGRFATEELAAKAYDDACKVLHGQFANHNNISDVAAPPLCACGQPVGHRGRPSHECFIEASISTSSATGLQGQG